jgi:hypothetical protein
MHLVRGGGHEPARQHPAIELLEVLGLNTIDLVGAKAGDQAALAVTERD